MRMIAIIVASCVILAAQDQAPARRPKVGVALAGGAALGLAHVGVLQWLEENRVPVDFIAGTSMGGLVGGIHASGLSAKEMIDFVQAIDWNTALAPSVPYRNLAFRRKEDVAQYPTALELGLKNGRLNIPGGLSSGAGVSLILDRFAAPYGSMRSFDQLPTPFRCVATDLEGMKGVVFDRGSLYDALRATMSLPAIFAPVRKDGRVLVDGGLTNNLPVDIVRAMGADVVIAVALDVPPEPGQLQSLLGIASRSVSYMIMANERPNVAAADIVLMPTLKGMTSSDYSKSEQFRRLGHEAAERKANALKALQVSSSDYEAFQRSRESRRRPTTIRPVAVTVEGDVAPKLKSAVAVALQPRDGASLDPKILEEEMEKLTGLGRFQTATYEFRTTDKGDELVVKVQEKYYAPPLLRPSIWIDGATGEGLRFGAAVRITFLDIGGPASEWRTDLGAGTFNRAETEYYHRIAGGKWFVAPRAGLTEEPFPLYLQNGTRFAEFSERNLFVGVDAGYAFGRSHELRLGHQYGHLRTSLNTGAFDPSSLSGRYGFTHLTLRHDTRNSPIIPTMGTSAVGRVSWYTRYPLANRDFAAAEGSVSRSISIAQRTYLLTNVRGAATANQVGLWTMFKLGGLSNLSALSRHELIGNRYYYGHAYVLREISPGAALPLGKLYGAIGYEAGRAWFPGGSSKPRHNGIIGVAGDTSLGALFVGGGIGDQGDRKFLLRIGRVF